MAGRVAGCVDESESRGAGGRKESTLHQVLVLHQHLCSMVSRGMLRLTLCCAAMSEAEARHQRRARVLPLPPLPTAACPCAQALYSCAPFPSPWQPHRSAPLGSHLRPPLWSRPMAPAELCSAVAKSPSSPCTCSRWSLGTPAGRPLQSVVGMMASAVGGLRCQYKSSGVALLCARRRLFIFCCNAFLLLGAPVQMLSRGWAVRAGWIRPEQQGYSSRASRALTQGSLSRG